MDGRGILIILNPPYHLNCPGKQSHNPPNFFQTERIDVPMYLLIGDLPLGSFLDFLFTIYISTWSFSLDLDSPACMTFMYEQLRVHLPGAVPFSLPSSLLCSDLWGFFCRWFAVVILDGCVWIWTLIYIYIYTDTHIYIYIQDACCCRNSTFHTCLATWDTTVVWESKG